MATLLEVAGKLGSLVAQRAPRKTGNLQRELRQQNTGRNILKGRNSAQAERDIVEALKNGTFTFEFSIDIAPPGAEYGQWWNEPTLAKNIKNGRTKNIPEGINFAQKAYDSAEFQSILDIYMNDLGEKVAKSVAANIARELDMS
jgi:hypothetical protein